MSHIFLSLWTGYSLAGASLAGSALAGTAFSGTAGATRMTWFLMMLAAGWAGLLAWAGGSGVLV